MEDADGGLELFAVDLAVPGGAAVHELVAEGVESVEKDGEEDGGFPFGEGLEGEALTVFEEAFPFGLRKASLLEEPERSENIRVVNKDADAVAVIVPGEGVDAVVFVHLADLVEEAVEEGTLGGGGVGVELAGVGRVEGNPEMQEAGVEIGGVFGDVEPAQGAVNAQADSGWRMIPHRPVPLFQCLIPVGHMWTIFNRLCLAKQKDAKSIKKGACYNG